MVLDTRHGKRFEGNVHTSTLTEKRGTHNNVDKTIFDVAVRCRDLLALRRSE
jgi:hypothetical protein